jgi:hypothetical protein
MSKQQTAVELLMQEIDNRDMGEIPMWIYDYCEQAKEMEKEQSIDFARHCLNKAKDLDILTAFMNTQQYYNDTFKKRLIMKTNTSSLMDGKYYTEAQKNEERVSNANIMQDLRVQKLIDKDIFDQATLAMEEHYGSGCESEIDAYFRGAKWMQDKIQGGNNEQQ